MILLPREARRHGRYVAASLLQEYVGYCLRPHNGAQKTLWLFGPPGSGKTTFVEVLEAMLGPKSGTLSYHSLASQFGLADLIGKRLVTATEVNARFLEHIETLNALVTGDTVRIEEKYQKPYTIRNKAKIIWAMNRLPTVSDPNAGIFRRALVVTFPQIPPERQDVRVKKGMREEGAGILNWALRGLRMFEERGSFLVPATVAARTAEWKEQNDPIGQFLSDWYTYRLGAKTVEVPSRYPSFRLWAKANGLAERRVPLKREFNRNIRERFGYSEVKSDGRRYWEGLELTEAGEDEMEVAKDKWSSYAD